MNKKLSMVLCVLLVISLIANVYFVVHVVKTRPDTMTERTLFAEEKAQIQALITQLDTAKDMSSATEIRKELFACHITLDNLVNLLGKEEIIFFSEHPHLAKHEPFDRYLLIHKTRDFLLNSSDQNLVNNIRTLQELWEALEEIYTETDSNNWSAEQFYTALQKNRGPINDLYADLK